MIFSQCSDRTTRETRWVGRKTETGPQDRFAGQINPAEAWWIAGRYQDNYSGDITWED